MMFAMLPLSPRVAFLCLAALFIGAAIPLAWAWTLLLPREPEPFAAPGEPEKVSRTPQPGRKRRDPVAVVFLIFVTLGYALQFPGVPKDVGTVWLSKIISGNAVHESALYLHWFFLAIPGVAALYALSTRSALRIPLLLAGALVLLLALLAPALGGAFLSP